MKKWTKHNDETKKRIWKTISDRYIFGWKPQLNWKKPKSLRAKIVIVEHIVINCLSYYNAERQNKLLKCNSHNDILDEECDGISTDDITITDLLKYINSLH